MPLIIGIEIVITGLVLISRQLLVAMGTSVLELHLGDGEIVVVPVPTGHLPHLFSCVHVCYTYHRLRRFSLFESSCHKAMYLAFVVSWDSRSHNIDGGIEDGAIEGSTDENTSRGIS